MNKDTNNSFSDTICSIVSSLPIAIAWKNTDLVYQGGNKYFAELLGYEKIDTIIGLKDADIFEEEEAVTLYASDDETIRGNFSQ
jgi:PAS domain-containing protein